MYKRPSMLSADPKLFRHPRRHRPIIRRSQPATTSPTLVALPRPPATRLRRRLLPLLLGSLLLHFLVLAAFWLSPPTPPADLATPPGVSMLFDQGATTPTEQPGSAPVPSAPMAAPANPSPQPAEATPPAPVEPPPAATPPTPAPQPVQPPPTPPIPQTESPTPEPTLPEDKTADSPAVRFQSPRSLRAFLEPVPIPQPLPMPPAPPRATPRPPSPARSSAGSFPHPMFNSLGTSLSGVAEGQRTATQSGGSSLQPFAQTSGTPLGAGWNEAFRNWVESHKYYPEQAAQLGQQGVVTVEMTIQSDGHVTDLRLVGRSGSPWLDMALQSMFRDAHVPPFPPGTKDPSVTYRVQMNYQLVH